MGIKKDIIKIMVKFAIATIAALALCVALYTFFPAVRSVAFVIPTVYNKTHSIPVFGGMGISYLVLAGLGLTLVFNRAVHGK